MFFCFTELQLSVFIPALMQTKQANLIQTKINFLAVMACGTKQLIKTRKKKGRKETEWVTACWSDLPDLQLPKSWEKQKNLLVIAKFLHVLPWNNFTFINHLLCEIFEMRTSLLYVKHLTCCRSDWLSAVSKHCYYTGCILYQRPNWIIMALRMKNLKELKQGRAEKSFCTICSPWQF